MSVHVAASYIKRYFYAVKNYNTVAAIVMLRKTTLASQTFNKTVRTATTTVEKVKVI